MKFTNAFTLFKTLYDSDLLKGFTIEPVGSLYGLSTDLLINTKIEQPRFIRLAEEIFNDWRWNTQKAVYPSDYDCKLYLNKNDDLCISIDAIHDLNEYHCDENIVDDILRCVVDKLSLEKLIHDEIDLENQFELNMKLEFDDFVSGKYDFSLFLIESSDDEANEATKIDNLINSHIESFGLKNLQKSIFDYFINLHDGNKDYQGICIEIEENNIEVFHGFGKNKDEDLKSYLENYPLNFALDIVKIQKMQIK